jgi:large subunit ribosomal protein L3
MLACMLGKKIGMTQIFDADKKVVPVTALFVGSWYVTQVKTKDIDGYCALQIGLPRKRYASLPFADDWLKKKKKFFQAVREVALSDETASYTLGQKVSLKDAAFQVGQLLSVAGLSTGKGFQGVVKRWGFAGGPAAHGSMFHRRPGAIGSLRTQGEVIKGKRLPGRAGYRRVMVKGLKLVHSDERGDVLFVKGAVPGKKDSLVEIHKQG